VTTTLKLEEENVCGIPGEQCYLSNCEV